MNSCSNGPQGVYCGHVGALCSEVYRGLQVGCQIENKCYDSCVNSVVVE